MAALKKRIFSGIQPSGIVQLGNYIGAIRNWVRLQDEYENLFCAVDMHAITVPQEPDALRKNTLEMIAYYLACGIDPNKSLLFVQSHIPEHAELNWALCTITGMGELSRMTQYKDKSAKMKGAVNAGLFNYPVLMAADILLYDTALVPVGDDQKQHVELARDLAIRFNGRYGKTFTVPEEYISKQGARIMSLADPAVKMSKSDPNPAAYIALSDDKDTIIKKFKRAVTDSDNTIRAAAEKPGVTNLLNIYSEIKGMTVAAAEKEFSGLGYGAFKEAVGNATADLVVPIRARQQEILKDTAYLKKIITTGAEKAAAIARPKLEEVYGKIGFVCTDM